MGKKFRVLAAALTGVLLLGSLAACSGKGDELIMATNAEFPPFEFVAETGVVENYDGIDIVIAQEIAKAMGKDLKIMNTAFESIIPALDSGKADLSLAGMTADDERRKNVDFSEPYWVAVQSIVIKEESTDITNVDSLQGKTVGVITGYTGDLAMDKKGGSTLKRYQKGVDAIEDLKNGKIDAVIIDSPTAENFIKKNPGLKGIEDPYFEKEEYAVAVKKGNTELLNQVNEVIAKLKEEGKISEIAAQVDERMAAN